jgi:hypothetical protein
MVVVVVAGSISSTNKPRLHPEPIFHTQKLTNANVEQYIEIHQRYPLRTGDKTCRNSIVLKIRTNETCRNNTTEIHIQFRDDTQFCPTVGANVTLAPNSSPINLTGINIVVYRRQ